MQENINANIVYYGNTNDPMVLIPNDIYQSFLSFKQRGREPESGAIILGHRRGKHFVIDTITTPRNNDVQRRTFYHRQDPSHITESQGFITKQDYTTYLGEWHTHPQVNPQPSDLDKREWQRISKMNANKPLLFIIVGLQSLYVSCGWKVLSFTEESIVDEDKLI